LAPAHTPQPIIGKLNTAINQGLKTPEFSGALAKVSVDPLGGTPEDFTQTMKTELARWSPLVKSLGLEGH
jgi:tripartite-type tricarboxylate transporter receptor subunit TctC